MSEEIFFQLAIILVIAFLVSYLARLFKQPLIMGYIVAGIIVSPFLIKFGATTEVINIFSKIGIAFLLFIVGLHLNPKVIKDIGKQSFVIGLVQMILTFGLTFLVAYKLFGMSVLGASYVGIALAFSSTIIVMKLLSDKGELDTLYGKLSIGILIVQDFFAVGVLIFLSTLSGDGTGFGILGLKALLIAFFLISGLFLIGRLFLSKIVRVVAKSQELLFLFSVCWCFLIAAIFAFFGFSLEIGALLAGMILSVSPYSREISSKVKPLRDFFLIIFFIILGLNIDILNIKNVIFPALILSALSLIFKPIIIMSSMALFKYTKKMNFKVGTTLSQISAFSLIILVSGVSLGHINPEILQMLTLTLAITILASTYMTIYSNKIFEKMSWLSIFERKKIKADTKKFRKKYEAILFGYNRTGFDILRSLTKLRKPYVVIDFDPDTIETLNKFKIPCLYGDVDDPKLLEELKLDKIDLAISTIPDYETNLMLLEAIREVNSDAVVISRATTVNEAFELYEKGSDYVLTPSFLSGEHVGKMIKSFKVNKKGYEKEKKKHLKRLAELEKKGKDIFRKSPHSKGKFHY